MDAKNSEMTKTADAIAALTEALAALGAAVEAKKGRARRDSETAGSGNRKKRNKTCPA